MTVRPADWARQVEAQKQRARASWKIESDTEIPGPVSMPKSHVEKAIGKDAIKVLERKTKSHAARTDDETQYQANSWNHPEEVQQRVLDSIDELMDIDPRMTGLACRPDYKIIRQGIPQPASHRRELLGLPRAFESDIFRESIEVVCLSLMEGVVRQFNGNEQALKVASWKVRLPSMRGKGLGFNDATDGEYPDLATGKAANLGMQKVIFPKMESSPEGVFLFEDKSYGLSYGWRNQISGFSVDENGILNNKWRVSYVHTPEGGDYVVPATQWEPADGQHGLRARGITMVPTVKNLGLIIENTIYMFNLPPRLKKIFKTTPAEFQVESLNQLKLCTDFSQFEYTQEDEVRVFVQQTLYSERVAKLARSIDAADMWCNYVDDWTSAEGTDPKIVWSHVPRSSNEEVRKMFSMLSSGTGDTALIGKVLGLATAVTYLSHAMNIRPAIILGYPGNDNCIAADVIRNLGDDCTYIMTALTKHGYTVTECEKFHVALVDAIDKHRYFDLTVESVNGDGGVFTGMRDYNYGGKDPRDPKSRVQFCHLDEFKLYANNLMKENSVTSGIRGVETEHLGLYGSVDTYLRTFADSGRSIDFQADHVERLFELSGFHGDLNALALLAEDEMNALMATDINLELVGEMMKKDLDELSKDEQRYLDLAKQWVIHKIMSSYNLKSADEISWKLEVDEIERVVGEIGLALLFLIVPKSLTTDGTRFINMNTFKRVDKHLRGDKYVPF